MDRRTDGHQPKCRKTSFLKNVCKSVKDKHVENGYNDIFVTTIG